MLLNQSKIERHKVDIEKRISELEHKLREPIKNSFAPEPQKPSDQPEYVEPAEVAEIRRRAALKDLKSSENHPQNHQYGYPMYSANKQNSSHYHQSRHIYPEESRKVKETINYHPPQSAYKKDSSYNNRKQLQVANETQDNRELYSMMSMIIQNQRLLQEEITLMRSEMTKKENTNQAFQTPYQAIDASSHVTSQLKANNPKEPYYEIRNVNQQIKKQQQPRDRVQSHNPNPHRNSNQRKIQPEGTKGKNKAREHISFQESGHFKSVEENEEQKNCQKQENEQIRGGKIVSKQKILTSNKKMTPVDIHSLVKNQKSRSERLEVSEELKSGFWKKVEGRIRESEKEYRDTFHRNNRHEHEHMMGTHELQRKLKGDLVQKIYAQCNKCIYK